MFVLYISRFRRRQWDELLPSLCCRWGIYKPASHHESLIILIPWGLGPFPRKSRNNDIKSEKRCSLLALGPLESARRGGIGLDVLAGGEGLPERAEERALLLVVKVADHGLDGLGGLLGLVEGDTAGQEIVSQECRRDSRVDKGANLRE